MLGFPVGYTNPCWGKQGRGTTAHKDVRQTLLGNTWSVPVVAWFLAQLCGPFGLCPTYTPQQIISFPIKPSCSRGFGDRPCGCCGEQHLRHHHLWSLNWAISFQSKVRTFSSPHRQVSLRVFIGCVRLSRPNCGGGRSLQDGDGPAHVSTAWSCELCSRASDGALNIGAMFAAGFCTWSTPWWCFMRYHGVDQAARSCVPLLLVLMPCYSVAPIRPSGAMCRQIKTPQTGPAGGVHGSARSSGMPKRHLEAATQAGRAKQRQRLGTLKDLTVQPATKQRYSKAIDKFLLFLRSNDLQLPRQRQHLDLLVCEYLEHLWSTGQGRALASDTVAGLQDQDIRLKGHMGGAWRLLKTWSINEIPNRAPPLPAHVLHAMVGWALFHQRFTFAVSLLLGFYGMLRTGEIVGLRGCHLMCETHNPKVLISLGLTKGGKRLGAAESAIVGYDLVVKFVQHWKA